MPDGLEAPVKFYREASHSGRRLAGYALDTWLPTSDGEIATDSGDKIPVTATATGRGAFARHVATLPEIVAGKQG